MWAQTFRRVPLIKKHCGECHTNGKRKGSLSLDTRASILKAKVVVPGKSSDSELFKRIVSDDPDEVVERIGDYVALGFDHLVLHAPGADQTRFLDQFAADVVPRLRERF